MSHGKSVSYDNWTQDFQLDDDHRVGHGVPGMGRSGCVEVDRIEEVRKAPHGLDTLVKAPVRRGFHTKNKRKMGFSDEKKFERHKDSKGREYEEFKGKRYTTLSVHEKLHRAKKDGTMGRSASVEVSGTVRVIAITQQGGVMFIVQGITAEGKEHA